MSLELLRFGTLGAARITPQALVDPSRDVAGVEVRGIAARDPESARQFAAKHEVPLVFADYDALLASDQIDCVYNPLPNGLHCAWTIRALEAGKHVLCEKPFASNAVEARTMADAARASGRVLAEAVHYLYHPLALRVRELLDEGGLGHVRHVRSHFGAPFPTTQDIRFELSLAGGSLMDMGFYPLSAARFVVGEEPVVTSAEARVGPPGIDIEMDAALSFPGGATARVSCAMHAEAPFEATLDVTCAHGEIRVVQPFLPHLGHRLTVVGPGAGAERTEELGKVPTYRYQLEAFAAHVRGGAPMWTGAENAVRTMTAIDAIYTSAGLPRRGS